LVKIQNINVKFFLDFAIKLLVVKMKLLFALLVYAITITDIFGQKNNSCDYDNEFNSLLFLLIFRNFKLKERLFTFNEQVFYKH
jgi:uncharacterized membrane protein (DUF373 family)